mmetsp:Transcript_34536/g.101498  ORF Transcript_34536/g.101498 Transcript_34536/m.101498 type:complete len:352 (-) Transcript_34536:11-1066(-)
MGNTSSLRVAIQQGRWRDVKQMLDEDQGTRERARTKTYHVTESGQPSGQTASALHLSCLHNPPADIIQTFLAINPNAGLGRSNPSGEVPLHYAVRCRKSGPADAAVRTLIASCPESISCRSSPQYGSRTPLHLACAVQANPAIIGLLRDADPTGARTVQDGTGQTAWDIAKRHKGVLSLVWRWKVRAILRSQSSITREDATTATPQQVRLDGLPMQLPTPTNSNLIAPSAPPLPNEDETPPQEGEDVCIVCWDRRADHAIVPCGHLCLCSRCSSYATLQGTLRGQCPVCKCVAQRAMKVFRSGVPNPGDGSIVASNSQAAPTPPTPPTVPALGNADGSSLPVAQALFVGTL